MPAEFGPGFEDSQNQGQRNNGEEEKEDERKMWECHRLQQIRVLKKAYFAEGWVEQGGNRKRIPVVTTIL